MSLSRILYKKQNKKIKIRALLPSWEDNKAHHKTVDTDPVNV